MLIWGPVSNRDIDISLVIRAVGIRRVLGTWIVLLIVHELLIFGLLRPIQVVWYWRLCEPIVRVGRLDQRVGPTFGKEPPSLTARFADTVIILVHVIERLVCREQFHDLGFRPVDLNVTGSSTVRGILRVGAANICDLQDHIRLALSRLLAVPKADTDILHAVT